MLLISIMVLGVITYIFANWYDKKYCVAWLYDQCGQPAKVIITLFRTGEYTEYFDLIKVVRDPNCDKNGVPSYLIKNKATGRETSIFLRWGSNSKLKGDMDWMTEIEREHLFVEINAIDRRNYWDAHYKKKDKSRSEGEIRKEETYEQLKHLIPQSERRTK